MSLPKYGDWIAVPKHLMTKTTLGKAGLSTRGLKPVAIINGYYDSYYLYDSTQAKPKRAPSEKQLAALAKGRQKPYTCPACSYVQPWKIERSRWGFVCVYCEMKRRDDYIKNCSESAATWARQVLYDRKAIILDTETTGLEGVVIQIGIIDMAGNVLLNTLVKNLERIEPGAQRVHGISEADLNDAPTWAEVWPRIEAIFNEASQLIVYNVDFDKQIIRNTNKAAGIEAKLNGYTWECAMETYAEWCGEWSDYHGNFKWQKLGGGHDALGDCHACLRKIFEMAYYKEPEFD